MTNTKYLKSLKTKLKENKKFFEMGIYTVQEYAYKNDIINQSLIKFKNR